MKASVNIPDPERIPFDEFLESDTDFGGNRFWETEELKGFVQELLDNGVESVCVGVESDGHCESALYLTIAEMVNSNLIPIICAKRPSEYNFEDETTLRLWWD